MRRCICLANRQRNEDVRCPRRSASAAGSGEAAVQQVAARGHGVHAAVDDPLLPANLRTRRGR